MNSQRFKSHRALHEVNGIIGYALKQFIGKRQVALCDVKKRLLFVIAAERTEAGQENVSEDADRPYVSFEWQRLVLNDFRRDEIWRSLNFAYTVAAFDGAREPKIAQQESICREIMKKTRFYLCSSDHRRVFQFYLPSCSNWAECFVVWYRDVQRSGGVSNLRPWAPHGCSCASPARSMNRCHQELLVDHPKPWKINYFSSK